MTPQALRDEAARLRQLADLEEAHARALMERARQSRKAAHGLEHAAGVVEALETPAASADYLGRL